MSNQYENTNINTKNTNTINKTGLIIWGYKTATHLAPANLRLDQVLLYVGVEFLLACNWAISEFKISNFAKAKYSKI